LIPAGTPQLPALPALPAAPVTTKANLAEADQASVAFHIALARIGFGTIEEAMALWTDVNPAKVAPTQERWLERAVTLVMSRRQWSRDLAFSYYRLVRALRTGATIKDPYHPGEPHPTLTSLRREFATAVDEVARVSGPTATQAPGKVATPSVGTDKNDRLLVEELKQLREEEVRLEKAAEEEARIALEALGPANLESKLKDLDPNASAKEMDAAREAAHQEAGVRQAAAAERMAMNGGRGALWSMAGQDSRVLGYARVSMTGTPCGFCAMLISRGAVYHSKASATSSDGDLYHDNCHCFAEPLFTTQQYASEKFALNRKYQAEWPTVTKGMGGKDALNAWRRYINSQRT